MIKARNTTTGAETEENTFEEAMAWGIFNLPGPDSELRERISDLKEEFELDGRTRFDDCQGRCYAETIEVWNMELWGEEEAEDW